jgi:hypothetical protein
MSGRCTIARQKKNIYLYILNSKKKLNNLAKLYFLKQKESSKNIIR